MSDCFQPDGDAEVRRATDAALSLLDVRARTRREIETRLAAKGYNEPLVGQVIEKLTRLGLLNDEQFAEQWVEERARAGGARAYGARKITQELFAKGVNADQIRVAVSAIGDTEERNLALRAAVKKVRAVPASPDLLQAERRKLIAFLQRRGFRWPAIKAAVGQVLPDADEGDALIGWEDEPNFAKE